MRQANSSLNHDPNVVPMIDIMLVLLIIFILIQSMTTRKVEVQLPDPTAALFAGRPDKILFVKGARTVSYQDVYSAFDAARGAGVHATGVILPP
jgi:biopolymer transport protein ExbD